MSGVPREAREVRAIDLPRLAVSVRIIDVGEPSEFTGELGHLERAELVPLASVDATATHWDREQPLLLVCRSGRRSLTAAHRLLELGFENVMNLEGGMLAVRRQEAKGA